MQVTRRELMRDVLVMAALCGLLIALLLAMTSCFRNPSLLTIQSGGKTTTITPQEVQERSDLARLCRELVVRREEITENREFDQNPQNQESYQRVLKGIEERLAFCRHKGAL